MAIHPPITSALWYPRPSAPHCPLLYIQQLQPNTTYTRPPLTCLQAKGNDNKARLFQLFTASTFTHYQRNRALNTLWCSPAQVPLTFIKVNRSKAPLPWCTSTLGTHSVKRVYRLKQFVECVSSHMCTCVCVLVHGEPLMSKDYSKLCAGQYKM